MILTAITLITLDERDVGVISTIRNTARDAIAPVQDAADTVVSPIGDWIDGITRAGSLKSENARLRRELAAARGEVARSATALRQNKRLRKLVNLPFIEQGTKTVAAQVVGSAPSNFEQTIVLDRGTGSGVVQGMPVVSGDGLVGRVIRASRTRATVLLLTDQESGVSVRLERSGSTGLAQGRSGQATLSVDLVKPDVKVRKGERAVTSGIDNSRFPAGIPVGEVVSVRYTAGELKQDVLLKASADIDRLEFVKVVVYPAAQETG